MKLLLCTPMLNAQTCLQLKHSVSDLQRECVQWHIQADTCDVAGGSLLADTRNQLATRMLREGDWSHMLAIDSDSGFDARDVMYMLKFANQPEYAILGAPFSKKVINWSRVIQVVKALPDIAPARLAEFAGEYNFRVPTRIDGGALPLDEPWEVPQIGMGLMIIRREVFERLRPTVRCYYHTPGECIYEFFTIGPDANGQYQGEDSSLCNRWREAGGKIWMAPWVKTEHVGTYAYPANLAGIIQAGGKLA